MILKGKNIIVGLTTLPFDLAVDGDPIFAMANEANRVTGEVPITEYDIYRLTTPVEYSGKMIDANTSTAVDSGDNNLLNPQFTYISLRKYTAIVSSVQVSGYNGAAKYYLIAWPTWTKTHITTVSSPSGGWVTLTPATASKCTYLIIEHAAGQLPTEIKINGSYIPKTTIVPAIRTKKPFKQYCGNNFFEWDVTKNNEQNVVQEARYDLVNINHVLRHYLDWSWMESIEGRYTYAPTFQGGWNYDVIYERLKADNKIVIACIKVLAGHIYNTYPSNWNGEDLRNSENIPAPWPTSWQYGVTTISQMQAYWEIPSSYISKGKMAFQFAARYGSNTAVDPSLISVFTEADGAAWWNANQKRIGLGYIKYMEAENERDKWWKWPFPAKSYSTGRAHAAECSAFYDGHKGTLGNNVGAKTADPSMHITIAGLASPSTDYIQGMVDWCREHRGYKSNGKVNLCFDGINYHHYSNDGGSAQYSGTVTRGMRPELTNMKEKALRMIKLADEELGGMTIWQTESGWDISSLSTQRAARPIDTPSNSDKNTRKRVQAEWSVALAMLYWTLGIDYFTFYSLRDTGYNDEYNTYQMSGWDDTTNEVVYTNRPIANIFAQLKSFFWEYTYTETLHQDPLVYKATNTSGDIIYALVVPDEVNRSENYELTIPVGFTNVRVWQLNLNTTSITPAIYATQNRVITIPVSEMYIFVQPTNSAVTTTDPLKKASSITFGQLGYKKESDPNVTLAATSNNNEVSITYTSSNTSIATISGSNLDIVGSGLVTITAHQTSSINFKAAENVSVQLIVIHEDGETNLTSIFDAGGWTQAQNNYSLVTYNPGWNTSIVFNTFIPAGQSGYVQMVCPWLSKNTGTIGLDAGTAGATYHDMDFCMWLSFENKVAVRASGEWISVVLVQNTTVVRIKVDATMGYFQQSIDGGNTFTTIATRPRPNVPLYIKGWGSTPEEMKNVTYKLL